jgi:hypothetical protein
MILWRLVGKSYFQKFQAIVEEVFFVSYVNSVGFKIDGSNLIYASCAPDMFPICFGANSLLAPKKSSSSLSGYQIFEIPYQPSFLFFFPYSLISI